jgi:hypothetical protein
VFAFALKITWLECSFHVNSLYFIVNICFVGECYISKTNKAANSMRVRASCQLQKSIWCVSIVVDKDKANVLIGCCYV